LQRFRPQTSRLLALVVFGVVLLTFAVAGTPQGPSVWKPSARGPRIKFDDEAYDFRTREEKEKITHVFKFKNVGNAPLKITRVRGTCRCITAVTTAETIEPGREGEIKATMDTTGIVGRTVKTVYVHSSDPVNPITKLTVRGVVEVLVVLNPRQVHIGRRLKGTPITQKVEIVWKRKEPLAVSGVTCSSKHITAKILRVEKTPFHRVSLEVTVGANAAIGTLNGKVNVRTTSKKWPVIVVPVTGVIEGEIKVTPLAFSFLQVQQGMSPSRRIRVTKAREPNLRVEKVVSTLDSLEIELKEIVKGQNYELNVRLKPDAPAGRISGKIHIYTNSLEQPKLTVAVYGLVRPKRGSRSTTPP